MGGMPRYATAAAAAGFRYGLSAAEDELAAAAAPPWRP